MGGYDLHGRYYPNVNDAINAEMAQCAEIDNRHNRKKIAELERKLSQPTPTDEEIHYLWAKVKELEERIAVLEGNPK